MRVFRALPRRFGFALALGLGLAVTLPAKDLADYQIGDAVEADIVTPVALRVVDRRDAKTLEREAAKVIPPTYRFNPSVADAVEANFRRAFAGVRSNFFEVMASFYQKNKVLPTWLGSRRFQMLTTTFKNQHRDLPHVDELIPSWALGNSDEEIQSALAVRLREAMRQRIRPDDLPDAIEPNPQMQLLTATNPPSALTVAEVEKQAELVDRESIATVSQARKVFSDPAAAPAEGTGKFLASFLQPNCVLDVELTRQSRSRHADSLLVTGDYEAGQVLVRRGELVDAKILAALVELQTQLAARPPAPPPAPAPVVAAAPPPKPWWLAGLVLIPAVGILVWRFTRRNRHASLLPARVTRDESGAAVIACPACDEEIIIPAGALAAANPADHPEWRVRALSAEQRAERAHAAIRSGALAQFTHWLKVKFVRRLISDRSRMLEAQNAAAAEMAEMERRLDDLHAPLQERLRAYEQRVCDLEKSLAAKDQENRELIKAKILLTRQQLAAERARNPAELN